jgi:two-component system, sensor histidine kinase and response regulator
LKKILFIDDNHELRQITLEALELEGFQVIGAENGRLGIEMAIKQLPNLILCDIMMPEIDGFEVCTQLKINALTSSSPFVFLTALADAENIHKGIEVCADDYIVKPFTLEELLETIDTSMRKTKIINAGNGERLKELRERIIKLLPTKNEKNSIH